MLDPTTYLNAAKSSYRIQEIKESFAKALALISKTMNTKWNNNTNIIDCLFENTNLNNYSNPYNNNQSYHKNNISNVNYKKENI